MASRKTVPRFRKERAEGFREVIRIELLRAGAAVHRSLSRPAIAGIGTRPGVRAS
jgi:hypothetical protein